jgi:hypothetical protein
LQTQVNLHLAQGWELHGTVIHNLDPLTRQGFTENGLFKPDHWYQAVAISTKYDVEKVFCTK